MLARVDWGRLVMIPCAVAILLLDVAAVPRQAASGSITVLRWLGIVGSAAYYTLLIWSYLRRGPAVATSGSRTGHACAVIANRVIFSRERGPKIAVLSLLVHVLAVVIAWCVVRSIAAPVLFGQVFQLVGGHGDDLGLAGRAGLLEFRQQVVVDVSDLLGRVALLNDQGIGLAAGIRRDSPGVDGRGGDEALERRA